MLSVEEQNLISDRLKTDPSVFPESWSLEDVISALTKQAEEKLDLDMFIECLSIMEELETAELTTHS